MLCVHEKGKEIIHISQQVFHRSPVSSNIDSCDILGRNNVNKYWKAGSV